MKIVNTNNNGCLALFGKPVWVRKSIATVGLFLALGFGLVLTGCPNAISGNDSDNDVTNDVTYDVTIAQPIGGTINASPTKGKTGTTVTLSNSPADNYAFAHYTVDGRTQTTSNFILNKNVTVSGVFTWIGKDPEPPVYTVTFDADGGAPTPQDQAVVSGGRVREPSGVSKNGYVLNGWYKEPIPSNQWDFSADNGWYKEATPSNQWDFSADIVTSDMTLYAMWTENIPGTFTVTYDGNAPDAIGVPSSVGNVESGSTISQPSSNPTRSGYIFSGWYKEAILVNQWNFSADIVTSDITLYAMWTEDVPETFTVTYDGNAPDAIDVPSSVGNVESGSTISQPSSSPTRSGYIFSGWYKEATLNNQWDFSADIVTSDMTLYAMWIENIPGTFTVTYDGNAPDAIDVPSPVGNVASGSTISQPSSSPTRSGYIFSGWYKEATLNNQWDFSADIVTSDMILYAMWQESEGSGDNSVVWRWSNQTMYTVADGIAGNVLYELNPTWISYIYIDEKHYEQQYSYTMPSNTYTVYDTYTYSTVGSMQVSLTSSRNGNTAQTVAHQITESTTTIDYVDPARDNSVTTTSLDMTTTTTTVYDEETGLTRSSTSTSTGTQNGVSYNSSSETNYTLELLSTVGDVKTYKVYDTTTGGTGAYGVYKVKNGVTLETKSYTAEDVLASTIVYTFPDNTAITAKIPTFTVYSTTLESNPESSNYQTCEVVSNSEVELKIRVKTYSTAGVLTSQYETTYVKHSL